MTKSTRRIGYGLATLALFVGCWWLLGPVQLGGPTGFAIIRGASMNPGVERGDFVLTRRQSGYGVGDAVLYENAQLKGNVLHRIIRVEGARFVLKGDNNDFLDGYKPTQDEVLGELWIVVPGMGRAIDYLREPLNAAVVFFVITFLALAGGRYATRRRRPYEHRPIDTGLSAPGPLAGAAARTTLTASLVALALFAGLALVAWGRDAHRTESVEGAFAHTGQFSYHGNAARSPAYPSGEVVTGQAVFTELVDRLELAFHYRFESSVQSDVRGSASLDLIISDGAGWVRTLPVTEPGPFEGPRADVVGSVSLARLQGIVSRVQELTGASLATVTVTAVPRVSVVGYAGSDVLDQTFAPSLPFSLDATSMRLSADDVESRLQPREVGTATRSVETAIGPAMLSLSTWEARVLSGLGLAVALLLAGLSGFVLSRKLHGTEADQIEARHGSRIVSVARAIPEGRFVTDVADFPSLVHVADTYERLILHSHDGRSDVYVVDDGVAVYRYATNDAAAADRSFSPAPGA